MPVSHNQCNLAVKTEKNYLVVKCDFCKKDMTVTGGSIIIGSKWYHDNCLNCVPVVSNNKSVSTDPKPQKDIKNIRAD